MDKYLHFTVMMVTSLLLCLLIMPIWALAICVIISVGKEVYDCYKENPTGFDLDDLIADLFGILVGMLGSAAIIWLS